MGLNFNGTEIGSDIKINGNEVQNLKMGTSDVWNSFPKISGITSYSSNYDGIYISNSYGEYIFSNRNICDMQPYGYAYEFCRVYKKNTSNNTFETLSYSFSGNNINQCQSSLIYEFNNDIYIVAFGCSTKYEGSSISATHTETYGTEIFKYNFANNKFISQKIYYEPLNVNDLNVSVYRTARGGYTSKAEQPARYFKSILMQDDDYIYVFIGSRNMVLKGSGSSSNELNPEYIGGYSPLMIRKSNINTYYTNLYHSFVFTFTCNGYIYREKTDKREGTSDTGYSLKKDNVVKVMNNNKIISLKDQLGNTKRFISLSYTGKFYYSPGKTLNLSMMYEIPSASEMITKIQQGTSSSSKSDTLKFSRVGRSEYNNSTWYFDYINKYFPEVPSDKVKIVGKIDDYTLLISTGLYSSELPYLCKATLYTNTSGSTPYGTFTSYLKLTELVDIVDYDNDYKNIPSMDGTIAASSTNFRNAYNQIIMYDNKNFLTTYATKVWRNKIQ